jgi:hypothetical protein
MGRDAWVRLGSIWNRFRDCVVVRTRPFSRRQGNVHETLLSHCSAFRSPSYTTTPRPRKHRA